MTWRKDGEMGGKAVEMEARREENTLNTSVTPPFYSILIYVYLFLLLLSCEVLNFRHESRVSGPSDCVQPG